MNKENVHVWSVSTMFLCGQYCTQLGGCAAIPGYIYCSCYMTPEDTRSGQVKLSDEQHSNITQQQTFHKTPCNDPLTSNLVLNTTIFRWWAGVKLLQPTLHTYRPRVGYLHTCMYVCILRYTVHCSMYQDQIDSCVAGYQSYLHTIVQGQLHLYWLRVQLKTTVLFIKCVIHYNSRR